jgi:hypothetical protein
MNFLQGYLSFFNDFHPLVLRNLEMMPINRLSKISNLQPLNNSMSQRYLIKGQTGVVLKRFFRFRWLIVFLFVAFTSVVACSTGDDVKAIRQLVSEGVRLGEEHDIGGLIKLVTDDFEGLPGNLDRREIRRFLWLVFKRYGEFHILHPLPKVTLESEGGSASATFPFLIVKKETTVPELKSLYEDPQRWLEEVGKNADLYLIKLDLVKTDGNWLVKRAHVESFKRGSFNE